MKRFLPALSVLTLALHVSAFAQDSDSLLAQACIEGWADRVEELLEDGADPNAVREDGWTPLMFAAMNGHTSVTKILLDAGADPNVASTEEGPPLCIAAMSPIEPEESPTDVVDALLNAGADPNGTNGSSMSALMYAAREGKTAVMRRLIDGGADPGWVDVRGWTPLWFAVRADNPEAVRILLDAGAYPDTHEEFPSRTPLHHAVTQAGPEVVALLLDAGADPDGDPIGSNAQLSPLAVAVSENRTDAVRLLLESGANPNLPTGGYFENEEGLPESLVAWARYYDNAEMEALLLEAGAIENIDSAYEEVAQAIMHDNDQAFEERYHSWIDPRIAFFDALDEQTTLGDVAAESGNLDALITLLEYRKPFTMWAIAGFATTALERSQPDESIYAYTEMVDYLVANYPDQLIYSAIGDYGMLAGEEGTDMLERILRESPGSANAYDMTLGTPLHTAADEADAAAVRLLLEAGADATMTDGYLETPLFPAVRQGDPEIVTMLIDAGAPIDEPNDIGITPLQAATRAGNSDIVGMLLELGADIESADKWGWRALHHAAFMGDLATATYLIEAGADVGARTFLNETPADIARQGEYDDLVRLLGFE